MLFQDCEIAHTGKFKLFNIRWIHFGSNESSILKLQSNLVHIKVTVRLEVFQVRDVELRQIYILLIFRKIGRNWDLVDIT